MPGDVPPSGVPVDSFRLRGVPAEALFLFSAVSQYIGASIAINLFDDLAPGGVAWLRCLGAVVALTAFSRATTGRLFGGRWTRADFFAAALLGTVTTLMNVFFFLAVDRLPLGKGVAIEFVGPIAVAAFRTKTRRNAIALGFAAIGVITLSGGEIRGEPLGLLFILLASAAWAAYILIAAKVARLDRGLSGLGVGLACGLLVTAPYGLPKALPAFDSARLVLLGMSVGIFSNAIGYGIDQVVLRRMATRRFAVMLALLPVTALVIGFVVLRQRPSLIDLVGVGMVLGGVVIQDRNDR